MQILFSGITTPIGFKAIGISSGIKKDNQLDLALLYSDVLCNCAGVFTKNIVKGHSLELAKNHVKNGKCQAVFINSGNANACVGPIGYEDAISITKTISKYLNINNNDVITGSTGVIGYRLPMETINNSLKYACNNLSYDGGNLASKAIMTTDTFNKEYSIKLLINDSLVTISGMAKGSGMIQPNMATMIAILTTDANISSELLNKALKYVVNRSFNKISIDGDTSVCDKTLILANGLSKCKEIVDSTPQYTQFVDALLEVSTELAKMITIDGEGATKLIEINVMNAHTQKDAELVAKSIANSPLVKTAFFGEDANWGRLLTAAGYSGAYFDPLKTEISIGSLKLFEKGVALTFDETKAKDILSKKEIKVTINFNDNNYSDTVWTCDFSYDYIKINAHYRT